MSEIKVHDKTFKTYISKEQIAEQVRRLGTEINNELKDRRPLFIAILNGSFMFASDLFKELKIEAEVCFIKLASYQGIKSTGNVVTSIGLDVSLKDRDIIIVEDIVDTGKTLSEFLPQVQAQSPASVRVAALLLKPEALKYPIEIDYVGFKVPTTFLLGYGLDYDGLGRNLDEIYQLVS